jgi:hypothetical protein
MDFTGGPPMNPHAAAVIKQLAREIARLQDLIKAIQAAFGDVPRGTLPKGKAARRGKAGEDRLPAAPKEE